MVKQIALNMEIIGDTFSQSSCFILKKNLKVRKKQVDKERVWGYNLIQN